MDCVWNDSTAIVLHRYGSGSLKSSLQSFGRGRRRSSTKIHVGLSKNYLHGVCLSGGERVDIKIFPTLWAGGNWKDIHFVIADKGYDFYDVRKHIRDARKEPIIPRRKKMRFPQVFSLNLRKNIALDLLSNISFLNSKKIKGSSCVSINWILLSSLSFASSASKSFSFSFNSSLTQLCQQSHSKFVQNEFFFRII